MTLAVSFRFEKNKIRKLNLSHSALLSSRYKHLWNEKRQKCDMVENLLWTTIVVCSILRISSFSVNHVTFAVGSMDSSYLGLETEDWDNEQYNLPPNNVPQTPGVLINNPMLSTTPGSTSGSVQNIVFPMAFPMIDRTLKKFNGFMHEDGTKFLAEFKSYVTLTGIDTTSSRAVVAFHLQLQGPALIWFNALPTHVKPSFVVQEKGRRLEKSDRDMTFKFIDGLPPQLAFFVRAGRVSTLRDALHSAKLGEAHGYRAHTNSNVPVQQDSTLTSSGRLQPTVSQDDSVQQLTKRVTALEVNSATPKNIRSNDKLKRKSGKSPVICFKCSGPSHIQKQCNWDGTGDSQPTTRCQLCDQMGHAATFCLKLPRKSTPQRQKNCQLCFTAGHIAKDCPQLNASGLGSLRGSQA